MEVIKIKDLPILDRPREKAKHYGIDKLNNSELLALIIGSGTKSNNALMIANSLLVKTKGIDNLLDYSYKDYLKVDGIKEATAFRFIAINELIKRINYSKNDGIYIDSKSLAIRYSYLIGNNDKESMYLILLNKKGEIVKEMQLYLGTNKSLLTSQKEIIDLIKKEEEKIFILIHNHPSGDVYPSDMDKSSTISLMHFAREEHIYFYDHIIVSKSNYYSFKDSDDLL